MSGNLVQAGPGHIHPTHDEVSPDVTLVSAHMMITNTDTLRSNFDSPEQHLLDHSLSGHNPDLSAGVEPVQLQLAGDGRGGLVTVRGCPGPSAVNVRSPDIRS